MRFKVLIQITVLLISIHTLFGKTKVGQNFFEYSQKIYLQQPDSSLYIIRALRNDSSASQDKHFAGNLYYWEGKIQLLAKNNTEQALVAFYNALNCYEYAKSDVDIANTLSWIGCCYRFSYNYKLSLEVYREELSIRDNLNSTRETFNLYLNLGLVYLSLEEYDSALNSFEKSLQLSKVLDSKFDMMSSYINLGSCFLASDRIDSALYYYNLSLPLAQELKDTVYMAKLYGNIGACHLENQQLEKARRFFNKALPLNEKFNSHNAIYTYFDLGDLNEALGNRDSSVFYFEKAANVEPDKAKLPIYKAVLRKLIAYYEGSHDILTAFNYSKKLDAITALYEDKFAKQEIEFKAYQAERVYIRHKNQKLETEVVNFEKKQLILLTVNAIMLVVFSILLIYLIRLNKRKNSLARTVVFLKEQFRLLLAIQKLFNLDVKEIKRLLNEDSSYKKFEDV